MNSQHQVAIHPGQHDAYLFDMDGTITQTFEAWMQIIQSTLNDYQIVADQKTIVRKIFGDAKAGLVELGVPKGELNEIFKVWDVKAAKLMLQVELYPGVREVLTALKRQGKKLALITASVRPTVEIALKAHQLQDTFDVTITGTEMEAPKPHPGGLLSAMRQLDVQADRTVMLGDSEKDIRAAHNAGIESVLFFPPEHEIFHNRAELQADAPTYTISSWHELLNVLGGQA